MWNVQILTIKLIEEKQKWENPSHNLILAQESNCNWSNKLNHIIYNRHQKIGTKFLFVYTCKPFWSSEIVYIFSRVTHTCMHIALWFHCWCKL